MRTKCRYCKRSLWGIPTNHLLCIRNESELNEWRIERLYRKLEKLEEKRKQLLNDEWLEYYFRSTG
jgi:hypothetical protein